MKKKNQSRFVTLLIIIVIVIIAILLLNRKPVETDEETAKCIGSKSLLYTQLGCSHCEAQKEMFGNNYQYLNVIDCWYDHQPCINNEIEGTPTWVIKGEKYEGVQTIEKLKELTGC